MASADWKHGFKMGCAANCRVVENEVSSWMATVSDSTGSERVVGMAIVEALTDLLGRMVAATEKVPE